MRIAATRICGLRHVDNSPPVRTIRRVRLERTRLHTEGGAMSVGNQPRSVSRSLAHSLRSRAKLAAGTFAAPGDSDMAAFALVRTSVLGAAVLAHRAVHRTAAGGWTAHQARQSVRHDSLLGIQPHRRRQLVGCHFLIEAWGPTTERNDSRRPRRGMDAPPTFNLRKLR